VDADISKKYEAAILNIEACRLTLDERRAVTYTQGWGMKADSKPIIYGSPVSTPVQNAGRVFWEQYTSRGRFYRSD
jgi:hypothetical protein